MQAFPPFSHIIIGNTEELYMNEAHLFTNPHQREEWLSGWNYIVNRSFLYGGDNKIVVTAFAVDEIVFGLYCDKLNYKNIANWNPTNKAASSSICDIICNDHPLLDRIVQALKASPGCILTSYCHTPQFERLLNKLQEYGVSFTMDNRSVDSALVKQLNSKAMFRRVVSEIEAEIGKKIMPEGNPFATREDALTEATRLTETRKPFVAKASFGVAGRGLYLSENPPSPNSTEQLRQLFKQDDIWAIAEIIIEEKIIADPALPLPSPSSEIQIGEDEIIITYLCNQVLSKKGEFQGISFGKNCLSPAMKAEIECISMLIAKEYQKLGYRGIFDIDFVVDTQQKLYAVETNARRTGGTHIYDIMQHIKEKAWVEKYYVVSNDYVYLKPKFTQIDALLKGLTNSLYSQKKGTGIILTNYTETKGMIGFMAICTSKQELQKCLAAIRRVSCP